MEHKFIGKLGASADTFTPSSNKLLILSSPFLSSLRQMYASARHVCSEAWQHPRKTLPVTVMAKSHQTQQRRNVLSKHGTAVSSNDSSANDLDVHFSHRGVQAEYSEAQWRCRSGYHSSRDGRVQASMFSFHLPECQRCTAITIAACVWLYFSISEDLFLPASLTLV